MLQRINDDLVGCPPRREMRLLSENRLHLASTNIDRGPGHKSRNSRKRDKVDNEAKTKQSEEQYDRTTNVCQSGSKDWWGYFGVDGLNLDDN